MTIHWWRTDKLVEDLALDNVSEGQSLRYAMISTVLVTASLYYTLWYGGVRGWSLVIEFAAVCLISLIGLNECFKANGGQSGAYFLKRLCCLGVPVGLKIFIVSVVVGQAMYFGFPRIFTTTSFRDPHFAYHFATSLLVGLYMVCYYWPIAYYMERVADANRSNPVLKRDT